MSGRYVTKVFQSGLNRKVKGTAAALASFADEDGGRIWPTREQLALMLDIDRRTVQRHLQVLKKLGILELVHPASGHRAPHYRMHLEALPRRRGGETIVSPGETPVSPLDGAKVGLLTHGRGDNECLPRGDTGVLLSPREPSYDPPVDPPIRTGAFAPVPVENPDTNPENPPRRPLTQGTFGPLRLKRVAPSWRQLTAVTRRVFESTPPEASSTDLKDAIKRELLQQCYAVPGSHEIAKALDAVERAVGWARAPPRR